MLGVEKLTPLGSEVFQNVVVSISKGKQVFSFNIQKMIIQHVDYRKEKSKLEFF